MHKSDSTLALVAQAGAAVLFLPASSPDFNPIEKMGSKVKASLRGTEARTPEELTPAIATALLRTNPFPERPPLFIRAVIYDYHFTRLGDGQPGWWTRKLLGLYCPPITLRGGIPTAVP